MRPWFAIRSRRGEFAIRPSSRAGDHALWNGYEEFPSRELWFPVLQIHAGRLISQYPEGFTLLALPFYRLLGYDGLFVLNALAFAGAVLLTYRLAHRYFGNRGLALDACLVLVFATYAWEYTQASMPHALSMLIVAGAVFLVVKALDAGTRGRALLAGLAGGGLIGFGATVRLDVMFALPLVIVPFLFVRPARPWLALSAGLATLPALICQRALAVRAVGGARLSTRRRELAGADAARQDSRRRLAPARFDSGRRAESPPRDRLPLSAAGSNSARRRSPEPRCRRTRASVEARGRRSSTLDQRRHSTSPRFR